jgi:multicomponent K+:H+ antiporter subunit D
VAVTQGLIGPWLILAAMVTLALGMTGVLGAKSLGRLAAFAAIGSMGTLLIAVALFTPQATTAALYYMIHSTLAGAALFLVVDLVRARRAGGDDSLVPAPPMAQGGFVAALFFAAAIGMAGMPPLSGFVGKLLVMTSARGHELDWLIWTVILATTLVAMVGFARAGSVLFWKTAGDAPVKAENEPVRYLAFTATCGLIGSVVLLTVTAGPVSQFLGATAAQLHDPAAYHAVLPKAGGQDQ